MFVLTTASQYCTVGSSQFNKARQRNKRHEYWREENKNTFDNLIVNVDNPSKSKKRKMLLLTYMHLARQG